MISFKRQYIEEINKCICLANFDALCGLIVYGNSLKE